MAAAQVDRALCICTTLEEFDAGARARDPLRQLLGHAPACTPTTKACASRRVDDLLALARLPRVVAIGETGLDYYRLNGRSVADMAWQRERFRVHIRAARATGLAAGGAHPQCLGRHAGDPERGGRRGARRRLPLLHRNRCRGARRARPRLLHLVLRHPDLQDRGRPARGGPLRAARPLPDRNRQPVPGARAAPRQDSTHPPYVPFVAQQIAAIKGLPVEAIAAATTANFERLFKVPSAQHGAHGSA